MPTDAVSRLLRALISRGVFRQWRDGRYDLTRLARTLMWGTPNSMAAVARFIGSPQDREHWSHCVDAVRTGMAVVPKLRGKQGFDYVASEPEMSEIFNQAMTNFSELAVTTVTAAYDFTGYRTIVDVAGGHGRLWRAFLLLHQPQRVLKNIVHDWPDDKALKILHTVRTAAREGATVLLIESVLPPHNRDCPTKWLDLAMLVDNAGRERTVAENTKPAAAEFISYDARSADGVTIQHRRGQSGLVKWHADRIPADRIRNPLAR